MDLLSDYEKGTFGKREVKLFTLSKPQWHFPVYGRTRV
jgi:hypothetical protein